jgi:hypothetical protein
LPEIVNGVAPANHLQNYADSEYLFVYINFVTIPEAIYGISMNDAK